MGSHFWWNWPYRVPHILKIVCFDQVRITPWVIYPCLYGSLKALNHTYNSLEQPSCTYFHHNLRNSHLHTCIVPHFKMAGMRIVHYVVNQWWFGGVRWDHLKSIIGVEVWKGVFSFAICQRGATIFFQSSEGLPRFSEILNKAIVHPRREVSRLCQSLEEGIQISQKKIKKPRSTPSNDFWMVRSLRCLQWMA